MTTFHPQTSPGEAPPTDSVRPRESTPAAPTSVSRLNETIRGFISTWGSVWVDGEVTAWNQRGGNVFGRLKDLGTDATISFRIWSSTRERLPADYIRRQTLKNAERYITPELKELEAKVLSAEEHSSKLEIEIF